MKTLGGYLVSGAGGDHLPTMEDGVRSHRLMGEAHAALFGGFRGNKYEGPDKEAAIAKLKAMYAEEKMAWPGVAAKQDSEYRVQVGCRVLQSTDAEGKAWDVEITKSGPADGTPALDWPTEVLKRDLQVFQGMPSYAGHLSDQDLAQGKGHPVDDLLGHIDNPRMGDGAAIGTLRLLNPSEWAPRFRAFQSLPEGVVGMSLDVRVRPDKVRGEGGRQRVAQIIKHPRNSLDLVSAPGGGGRILRAVASRNGESWEEIPSSDFSPTAQLEPNAGTKAGGNMKEKIQRILQAIKRFDPAKAGTLETEIASLEENEQLERVTQALATIEPPKVVEIEKPAAGAGLSEADRATLQQATTSIQEARVIQCGAILQQELANSGLPVPLVEEVERRFKDKVFDKKDLLEDIKQVRQTYARVVPAHRVTDPSVRITLQDSDKLQIALYKTFGLTHEMRAERDARGFERVVQGAALPGPEIPAFAGIREAYVAYTGDPEVTGSTKLQRVTQIFNTAGFPNALAATLNRLLLKDYAAVDYRWRDIVTALTAPSDFRTQERIRVGYFGDLALIAEDGTFDEIDAFDDEKISYSVDTRGNMATITRRTILNDDLQVVSKIVGRLARSAARTLARFVWNFPIANATYAVDAKAWFHTDHNNLGTTALSGTALTDSATLTAIDAAFFNQTEKDSGEVLALSGPYLLSVPKVLQPVAISLNQSQYLTNAFLANPWYHRFGVNNENIFANPFMTEDDDWLVFDISGNVDLIEIGFLQGRQTPEFFQADNPTVDQMFTQDRIRYKVRHEYSGNILDFRGAFKEVPA